jgi:hypothetical protein
MTSGRCLRLLLGLDGRKTRDGSAGSKSLCGDRHAYIHYVPSRLTLCKTRGGLYRRQRIGFGLSGSPLNIDGEREAEHIIHRIVSIKPFLSAVEVRPTSKAKQVIITHRRRPCTGQALQDRKASSRICLCIILSNIRRLSPRRQRRCIDQHSWITVFCCNYNREI